MKRLLFFSVASFAMITSFSQTPSWKGKFEQLGPETISTPNSYRTGSGAPGPNYWQQRADYTIDVEVNDEPIYSQEKKPSPIIITLLKI